MSNETLDGAIFPVFCLGFDLFVSVQPDKSNIRVGFTLQPAVVISHLRQAMNSLEIYCANTKLKADVPRES